MNGLDIFFIALLIYSLYKGYKIGLLAELCGVLGIIIGVYIAYSLTDGVLQKIGSTSTTSYVVVFIVLLGLAYIGQILLARLISKAFDLGGLGIINRIGGAAASLLKVVLMLSIVVSLLLKVNDTYNLGARGPVAGSKIVPIFEKISGVIFPYVQLPEWNLNIIKEKIDNLTPTLEPAATEPTINLADTTAPKNITDTTAIENKTDSTATLEGTTHNAVDTTSMWNKFLESLKTK